VTEVAPPAVDTRPSRTATSPKMPARELVAQTLTAASRDVKEVYTGRARWLPLFLRIASSLMEGEDCKDLRGAQERSLVVSRSRATPLTRVGHADNDATSRATNRIAPKNWTVHGREPR